MLNLSGEVIRIGPIQRVDSYNPLLAIKNRSIAHKSNPIFQPI
jgi:hypothetical protein